MATRPNYVGVVVPTILIVCAALIGIGLLPVAPWGNTVVGTPLSYHDALGIVGPFLAKEEGAPWIVVQELGFGSTQSFGVAPSLTSSIYGSCNAVLLPSESFILAARPSESPPGTYPNWAVVARNSASEMLVVYVTDVDEPTTNLAGIFEGNCTSLYANSTAIDSNTVDSTTIGFATNSVGGTNFLSNYPRATEEAYLVSGAWVVLYTTCSPYNTQGSGAYFAAGYQASTGDSFVAPNLGDVPCSQVSFVPRVSSAPLLV